VANDIMDKIIADLIKGAQESEGFMRGSRAKVEIGRDRGHEVKLANHGGMGALIGGVGPGMGDMGAKNPIFGHAVGNLGGQAGAAIGAGLGADPGRGLNAAIDAGIGHSVGGWAGSGLGSLLHLSPEAIDVARRISATGGSMIGGQIGGHDDRGTLDRLRNKNSALDARYTDGVKAAAEAFGVKEAFLPALLPLAGSLLGGTALRAGAGALARGAGGKALGGLASKALPAMGKGMGGMATDMIGSQIGGAVGQKLAPQQQQPQQMN
jgi:hypothetical protein